MKACLLPVCLTNTDIKINKVALIIAKLVDLSMRHVDNLDRVPVLVL